MQVRSRNFDIETKRGNLAAYLRTASGSHSTRGPLVVLSHGLTNDHSDAPLFAELTEQLSLANYDVLTFDYYGSGRSGGEFRDKTLGVLRENLSAVVEYAYRRLCDGRPASIALIGRSAGGSMSAFLAKHPAVASLVLASPPIDLVKCFHDVLYSAPVNGFVRLPARIRPSGQLKGEYELPESFFDELPHLTGDIHSALDGARCVLLIEGGADYKLPHGQMDAARANLGVSSRYVFVPGLDHDYGGFEDEAVELAMQWLARMRRLAGRHGDQNALAEQL